MKSYPLQPLLDLRQRAEVESERALALALQSLARARESLTQAEQALAEHQQVRNHRAEALLTRTQAHGANAGTLVRAQQHAERLRSEQRAREDAVARLREEVHAANQAVEVRRKELLEATRERKALEKHHEAWARQLQVERERREERTQDETASALTDRRSRRTT
ncbi:MAG: hypothetical protein L0Y66_11940 [Myxococcaceae bacterium]|nr:hypothetical protein [Myxococcaceae bacterium]MCI0673489.1 hypothetical protein [Myxococcaceae bacterium]